MARSLIALLLLVATTAADAAIVRIRSSANVEQAIVRLEDVAEVYEDDAELLSRLKAVTIEPAPAPGAQRRLNLQQIIDRLRAHRIDLSSIEFSGRTVVLVSRKPEAAQLKTTPARGSMEPQVNPFNRPNSTTTPIKQVAAEVPVSPDVKLANRALRLTSKEIRDAEKLVYDLVRDHMTEKAPNWGNPRISVHVPTTYMPKLLDAPVGGVRLAEGHKISGTTFGIALEITNEFGDEEVIKVTADIVKRPKAVVTTRAIPVGHILRESDLRFDEVDVVQREATELEQVVGKETKTPLRVGQRVMMDFVGEPKLVRRGDKIKGEVVVGSISVSQEFKALRDGRLHEIIDLETIIEPGALKTARPEKRSGMVIGPKLLEIIDAPEGSVRTGLQIQRAEQ